jgi:hypothetical protein
MEVADWVRKGPDLAEHEVVRWRRCSSFPATGAAITPSTICTAIRGFSGPLPMTEAACRSHGRRKFFVPADVTAKPRGKLPVLQPLALEAVRLLDAHEPDRLKFFGVMVLIVSSLVRFTGGPSQISMSPSFAFNPILKTT